MAIPLAILCALALAATAASLFALMYAKALVRQAKERTTEIQSEIENELRATQASVEQLSAEVRDIGHEPALTVTSVPPRPGLNLTTRSQVLRLHRRGETVGQIAKVLQVPRQEVELLLKVHRIVLNSMDVHENRIGYALGPEPHQAQTIG